MFWWFFSSDSYWFIWLVVLSSSWEIWSIKRSLRVCISCLCEVEWIADWARRGVCLESLELTRTGGRFDAVEEVGSEVYDLCELLCGGGADPLGVSDPFSFWFGGKPWLRGYSFGLAESNRAIGWAPEGLGGLKLTSFVTLRGMAPTPLVPVSFGPLICEF